MTTKDILRQNLKHLRRQFHETQLEAASETGISEGHLRNMENGATNPSISVLDKLAAHYGTQTAQLLLLQPHAAKLPDMQNALDPQAFEPPCMHCPLLKWLREQGQNG